MRLINIIDEANRFSGFRADTTNLPQADSHKVSYLYARNHYYGEDNFGIAADDFEERNKEAIVLKVLKSYDFEIVSDNYGRS